MKTYAIRNIVINEEEMKLISEAYSATEEYGYPLFKLDKKGNKMKVIAKDSLNRGYIPERLITVSVSQQEAETITNSLNQLNNQDFYRVVGDNYQLNLKSIYDVIDETAPEAFYIKQYGLTALFGICNMEYYKGTTRGINRWQTNY